MPEVTEKLIQEIVKNIMQGNQNKMLSGNSNEDLLLIPVGVSNRHVHLCRKDMDALFGEGSELTEYRELTQKGYFAAKETVTLVGPKGAINKVRLLGPLRSDTQIEVLASDRFALGIEPRGQRIRIADTGTNDYDCRPERNGYQ